MRTIPLLLVLSFTLSGFQLPAQEEEYGLASYFSDDFQGRSTAYGDTYDRNEMTCAHKRYPYGSMLRVTRLDNRRSVDVKVIDKGPFIRGRVVDLSYRAAEQLGIIDDGSVEVKVTLLRTPSQTAAAPATNPAQEPAAAQEPNVPESYDEAAPGPETTPSPERSTVDPAAQANADANRGETQDPPASTSTPSAPRTTQQQTTPANDRFRRVGEDFTPMGLYRIVLERPTTANYGVQVGSFASFDNVLSKVAELQAKWFENILVNIEPGSNNNPVYKVLLGPFDNETQAQQYQRSLQSRYNIRGFVVSLNAGADDGNDE
ncbi:MAG: septal ring lytic transglycosylase RlpA family protein [Lewinella sp.]|nr:septal ring lytic transglycosylase RlpA family protein [Lewinella sp.]